VWLYSPSPLYTGGAIRGQTIRLNSCMSERWVDLALREWWPPSALNRRGSLRDARSPQRRRAGPVCDRVLISIPAEFSTRNALNWHEGSQHDRGPAYDLQSGTMALERGNPGGSPRARRQPACTYPHLPLLDVALACILRRLEALLRPPNVYVSLLQYEHHRPIKTCPIVCELMLSVYPLRYSLAGCLADALAMRL